MRNDGPRIWKKFKQWFDTIRGKKEKYRSKTHRMLIGLKRNYASTRRELMNVCVLNLYEATWRKASDNKEEQVKWNEPYSRRYLAVSLVSFGWNLILIILQKCYMKDINFLLHILFDCASFEREREREIFWHVKRLMNSNSIVKYSLIYRAYTKKMGKGKQK